jgi:hypothetical protein
MSDNTNNNNNIHNTTNNTQGVTVMYGNEQRQLVPASQDENISVSKWDWDTLQFRLENEKKSRNMADETIDKCRHVVREMLMKIRDVCGDDFWEEISDQTEWLVNDFGMDALTKTLHVEVTYTVRQRGTVEVPVWFDEEDGCDESALSIEVDSCGDFYNEYDCDLDTDIVDFETDRWEVRD